MEVEKIRDELRTAHMALVEPTPSGKRRAADDLDLPSTSSSSKRNPKRAKSTDSTPSLRRPAKPSTAKTGTRIKTDAGFEWDVPPSSEASFTSALEASHMRRSERTQRSVVDEELAQDYTPDGDTCDQQLLVINGLSPHDTIMNTSSGRPSGSTGLDCSDQGIPDNLQTADLRESRAMTRFSPDPMIERIIEHEKPEAGAIEDMDELQQQDVPGNEPQKAQPEVDTTTSKEKAVSKNEKPKGKKRKSAASEEETSPEPNSEELIGLPKEMYVPRPSRSRSARTRSGDSLDLTPQPGKLSKAKPKRRKTTGWVLSSGNSQLREMGFTSSQAEKALMEADGQVDIAIELLTGASQDAKSISSNRRKSTLAAVVEEEDGEQEAEPGNTSDPSATNAVLEKRSQTTLNSGRNSASTHKATKSKKDVANSAGGLEDDDAAPHRAEQRTKDVAAPDSWTNSDVIVVINADLKDAAGPQTSKAAQANESVAPASDTCVKRGRGRPKNTINIAQDNDDGEDEDELQMSSDAMRNKQREDQDARGKKDKGDGQTKAKIVVEAVVDDVASEREQANDADARDSCPAQSREQTILQATTPNKPPHRVPDARKPDIAAPSSTPTDENSSEKTQESSKTPPKRHSPLAAGRVPLKVGLSRRMRVEPLLRMIRK